MKRYFILLIAVFSICACDDLTSPMIPKGPQAKIILDGDISWRLSYFGCLQFTGIVKNIGENTAYNCTVIIECYGDVSKRIRIDLAKGFPANLGDIVPGQRSFFEANAYNLQSYSQVKAFDYAIFWMSR